MDQLGKEMRFGLRMIRKSPGFAAGAILTLALGIGGTTAIFSFVDAVLLKILPFPGADQILNVLEKPPGGEHNGISTLNFLDWKNQNTVFTAMAARSWGSVTLTDAVVLETGMALNGAGLVIGVLGALALTRILSSLLFGVSPRDPWTLLFVSTVLAVVAVAACYIPARRATQVDPLVAPA